MADQGRGGSGGKPGSSDGQSLNHGRGSFAHNNRGQLPGGTTGPEKSTSQLRAQFDQQRDPLIARQIADQGKTEAQRRRGLTEEERRVAFNATRQRHAPGAVPTLRPTNSRGVDQASFAARQRQEDWAARKDQPVGNWQNQPAPAKAPTVDQKSFALSRQFTAKSQGPSRSSGPGRGSGRSTGQGSGRGR